MVFLRRVRRDEKRALGVQVGAHERGDVGRHAEAQAARPRLAGLHQGGVGVEADDALAGADVTVWVQRPGAVSLHGTY
jgi:hypothetical protein